MCVGGMISGMKKYKYLVRMDYGLSPGTRPLDFRLPVGAAWGNRYEATPWTVTGSEEQVLVVVSG